MATTQHLASFVSQLSDFEGARAAVYPPLDTNDREFRLMTIQPGAFEDDVKITLEKASLDADRSYEAISYTWEDLNQTRTVYLQGHEYMVTRSQFEAVRHFRLADTTRVLWMDVFCIDQENLAEKNNQVSMMGEIYAGATTTQVWLGQFGDDWIGVVDPTELKKAAELLRNNPDLPRTSEVENRLTPSPHLSDFNKASDGEMGPLLGAVYVLMLLAGNHHLLQMPVYSLDDEGKACPNQNWYNAIETLRLILNRPWWERAWVVQEVAWSQKPPMVHIGGFQVPLKTFCSAAASLYNHVVQPDACCVRNFEAWGLRGVADKQALITKITILFRFYSVRENVKAGQISFLDALSMSSSSKVTDARDCVYSVLSLMPEDQRVHVDYNYSVAELFTLTFWKAIKVKNSLNILQQSGSKNRAKDWQLPSWIRDWSKDPTYGTLFEWIHNTKTYNVLPDWSRTIFDSNDQSLTCPYKKIDKVQACFPASIASQNWKFYVLSTIWLRQLREAGYNLDLTTFIRTVFRNTGVNTNSAMSIEEIENLVAKYQQCAESGNRDEPDMPGSALHILQYTFSSSIRESCLFVTEQNRLGIGHEGIQPGDILCHVRGCCVPLVVRRLVSADISTIEDPERFAMVDACYVDGAMDLEAQDVDWAKTKNLKLL